MLRRERRQPWHGQLYCNTTGLCEASIERGDLFWKDGERTLCLNCFNASWNSDIIYMDKYPMAWLDLYVRIAETLLLKKHHAPAQLRLPGIP